MKVRKLQKLFRGSIGGILPAKKARGRLRSVIKSLIIALLSFTLAVSWGSAAWGQFPFLSLVEGSDNDKPIVDFFNRPYPCGNLICTQVWFGGMPILEIASEAVTEEEEQSGFSVELRAKRIQNNLQQILKTAIDGNSILETSAKVPTLLLESASGGLLAPITESKEQESSAQNPNLAQTTPPETPQPETQKEENAPLIPYLNKNNPSKSNPPNNEGLHPNTPKIEVGTLNGETVVFYIPKAKGLSNIKIMTVTRADVLYHGKLPEELAQEWQGKIRYWLSFALAEKDLQAGYPFLKLAIIGGLVLLMVLLGAGVGWLKKRTRDRYKKLKAELRGLEESLAVDPESATNEGENPEAIEEEEDRPQQPAPKTNHPLDLTHQLGSLWRNLPKFFLKKHSVLKQQHNLALLSLQILIWAQTLIWVWGTCVIFLVYPSARAIGYLLLQKTFPIIGIWVLVTLADKISNFLIDANLNAWAENAELTDQSSTRYALRVSTYSSALNNLSSVIFWLIGIIWTAEVLGVATTVLASAGIVAVVVTYFSQNLVRDAINGLLILITDRYAVGDVILVGDIGGFVEKMNLYMTHLRSADGQLITIPNGEIAIVKNLTKDWSRVDFFIEVAYDADVKRALQVLREVSEELYADPDWRDYLAAPIEVLGIEDISHSGLQLRVWLKTQPLKQWLVGREFRLRVKQAFDREGIAIGIPQRSLSVKNDRHFLHANGKSQEGAIDK